MTIGVTPTMNNLSRRSLIAGLAVAGLPLGVKAMAIPLAVSPVFPTVIGPSANVQRREWQPPVVASPYEMAKYYSGVGKDKFCPMPYTLPVITRTEYSVSASDGVLVTSVEDAEDRLFASLTVNPATRLRNWQRVDMGATWLDGDSTSPAILLMRQSNLIAVDHRIGVGNVAFMHPDTKVALTENQWIGPWVDYPKPERVGRWTKAACFNENLMIYTSPHLPMLEVIMAHNSGIIDGVVVGPAVLLQNGSAKHLINCAGTHHPEQGSGAPIRKIVFEDERA